jgi:hypothetical protein
MSQLEKPLLLLDKIIYPKPLRECINDFFKNYVSQNKLLAQFFGESYVRVVVVVDYDKKRLNELSTEIRQYFYNYVNSVKVMALIDNDIRDTLSSIASQLDNGISDSAFNEWFMRICFHSRQMTVPLDEFGQAKKDYNPCSQILEAEYEEGFFVHYIFFSSDGSLMNQHTIGQLVDTVEKLVIEKLKSQKKKNHTKRNPLDSKLRHECFKRDGYKCVECGATKDQKMLHADHIIPVSQGGTDELSNLQTLCADCNLAKYNRAWSPEQKREIDGENGFER